MWGIIFVNYIILMYDPKAKSIVNFVKWLETVRIITVYSGYWISLALVALVTTALNMPIFNIRLDSFYTANGDETPNSAWLGWFLLFWYVLLVTLDIYV